MSPELADSRSSSRTARWLALLLSTLACGEARSGSDTVQAPPGPAVVDSFQSVPDSAWIDVQGPTIIGFFPSATNDLLERDGDLAELLDHFAFNLGMATDSLEAHGFDVTMQHGDTLWLRTTTHQWRFVREADSALVGFYVTSPDARSSVRYGSGVEFDLVELGETFLRSEPARDDQQPGAPRDGATPRIPRG